MGSWDETCVISDIGIGVGDEVYCFLAAEPNYKGSASWNPITPLLPAVYNDYGTAGLCSGELPDWILNVLSKYIEPIDEGKNPFHENSVDPNNLSWESIVNAKHQSRLFIRLRPKYFDSEIKETANKRLQNFLDDNGLPIRVSVIGETGSTISYGEISDENMFDKECGYTIHQKLDQAIKNSDWTYMAVPHDSFSLQKDADPNNPKEWYRSFIFGPRYNQSKLSTYFGRKPLFRTKLDIFMVRKDVLDSLVPKNAGISALANKAKRVLKASKEGLSEDNETIRYMVEMNILDTFGIGYAAHIISNKIIADMILSSPDNFDFKDWARTYSMASKANIVWRRGLRPRVMSAGSQFSDEDSLAQLSYHKELLAVLEKKAYNDFYIEFYKEDREEHHLFHPGEADKFIDWVNENCVITNGTLLGKDYVGLQKAFNILDLNGYSVF